MIDAVIYGMIPRAKMVRRRSWPPENRSTKPKVPLFCSKIVAACLHLHAGVGI